jgi:hypothetical protein
MFKPLNTHKNLTVLVALFSFVTTAIYAQTDTLGDQTHNAADYQIGIKRALKPIVVDGVLDESDWENASVAKDFWQKYPDNKTRAKTKTEARLTYDDHFLYIAFVCYDSSKNHIIPTLKRDAKYFDGDGIAVTLDPINRQSNAYLFGVSPLGVQSETTIQSFGDPTFSWDNIWVANTKQYADRWTVEMAIPFKTLRYEAGKTNWGINFVRNDLKHGQYHTWARVPLQFAGYSLGFYGTLNWDAPPPTEKSNVTLIPYALGGLSKDFEAKTDVDKVGRIGGDAKIALNSQLNLDATVNPDFSQVDVDEQITNLTRFNPFYPEKRTFFLENSDVLAELGAPPGERPFFSRRIGLDANAQRVPIQMGLRLSGNLNKTLRINVLDMQTAKTTSQPSYNYAAAAVQQALVGRSFIKLGLLNRQNFTDAKNDYIRNLAGELSFTSKNNQWDGWFLFHHSVQPNITKNNNFTQAGIWYHNERWEFLEYFGETGTNYATGMDYYQRIDNYDALSRQTIKIGYKQNTMIFNYKTIPKKSKYVAQNEVQAFNAVYWNPNNSLNDRSLEVSDKILFRNTAQLRLSLFSEDSRLPVNTAFTDFVPLPPNKYVFTNVSARYNTDIRKKLVFKSSITYGEFYNGKQLAMTAGIDYRQTPWGVFGLRIERYDLQFPEPYKTNLLYLINSKAEFCFTKNLNWTTFLQYNTQADNFNINSRLQWRFKPMSDLFIVYTDNYATTPFDKKNRALVLKMNYWLNL